MKARSAAHGASGLTERLGRIVTQGEMPQIGDDSAVVLNDGDLVDLAANAQTPVIQSIGKFLAARNVLERRDTDMRKLNRRERTAHQRPRRAVRLTEGSGVM